MLPANILYHAYAFNKYFNVNVENEFFLKNEIILGLTFWHTFIMLGPYITSILTTLLGAFIVKGAKEVVDNA
jgi:hypothetical protein